MSHYIIANSGSPLMIATFAHLVIGNTLIGILEGLLISRFLKVSKWKAVFITIIANYVSAWIGMILIEGVMYSLESTIESVKWVLTIAMICAFFLTLILEYPFLTMITFGLDIPRPRKIRTLIAVNLVSYSFMILPWYFYFSHISLLKLKVTSVEDISSDPHLLAFLGPEENEIRVYDLALHKIVGTHPIKIAGPPYGPWYLRSDLEFEDSKLLPHEEISEADRRMHEEAVRRLQPREILEFELENSFSWTRGLRVRDSESGAEVFYKLETPFVDWSLSSVTQIKDGLVVFQLGQDQICLANFRKRTIGLIGHGSDPVVLDQDAESPADSR